MANCQQCGKELVARGHGKNQSRIPTAFCDLTCKGRYVAATRSSTTTERRQREPFTGVPLDPSAFDWLPKLTRWGGWYGAGTSPGEVRLALVGEQLNTNRVQAGWPPLYGGVTGTFLRWCLLAAKIRPEQCYYTNAVKGRGQVDDLRSELWEAQPDHVVALGDPAHERLWAAGISHWHFPHPAYWVRWHKDRRDEYISALKELAK